MSVGGRVIEVLQIGQDKTWVNTHDGYSECAVYCDASKLPFGEKIQPGDMLWWQSGVCYWTPKDKHIIEFKLRKIGFSGISQTTAVIGKIQERSQNNER